MKYISLNTHSWVEEEPLKKLKDTADFILANDIEIIALQEVNQLNTSKVVSVDGKFCPISEMRIPIKEDNYAKLLVDYLKENGQDYYWSWTCSHMGYNIYDEGSAILSKYPFKAENLLVSASHYGAEDHRRREVLLAHITEPDLEVTVASCHLSWWSEESTEGFYTEWTNLNKSVSSLSHQILLLGDFNIPAHIKGEGYSLVTENYLDCFKLAEKIKGSYTIPQEIDGWEGNTEPLRIDFAFAAKSASVLSHEVIFDGQNGPIVSDHFGIMMELNS